MNEDLDDIAEQTAFGTNHLAPGYNHRRPASPQSVRCGSPDHLQGKNIRIYRKGAKGKVRMVCRLCDAARRRAIKPTFEGIRYE